MAKRKSKAPVLRAGLNVDQLLAGSWMVREGRYRREDELTDVVDSVLRAACQGLIDEADSGERVTRRTVINTLCAISDMLIAAKDTINEGLGSDKLTPTLLDRIAGA